MTLICAAITFLVAGRHLDWVAIYYLYYPFGVNIFLCFCHDIVLFCAIQELLEQVKSNISFNLVQQFKANGGNPI